MGGIDSGTNIKDLASNVFNFLYKGLPKINDTTVYIKKDM